LQRAKHIGYPFGHGVASAWVSPDWIESLVPTTGISNKHLSLVDKCHVMGTAHLYKQRPLAHCPATVEGHDNSHKHGSVIYLSNLDILCSGFTTGLYLTYLPYFRRVAVHSVRGLAKYTSGGNSITMTRQTRTRFWFSRHNFKGAQNSFAYDQQVHVSASQPKLSSGQTTIKEYQITLTRHPSSCSALHRSHVLQFIRLLIFAR